MNDEYAFICGWWSMPKIQITKTTISFAISSSQRFVPFAWKIQRSIRRVYPKFDETFTCKRFLVVKPNSCQKIDRERETEQDRLNEYGRREINFQFFLNCRVHQFHNCNNTHTHARTQRTMSMPMPMQIQCTDFTSVTLANTKVNSMSNLKTQTKIKSINTHKICQSKQSQPSKIINRIHIYIGKAARKSLHWNIRFERAHNGNGCTTHLLEIWLHRERFTDYGQQSEYR